MYTMEYNVALRSNGLDGYKAIYRELKRRK